MVYIPKKGRGKSRKQVRPPTVLDYIKMSIAGLVLAAIVATFIFLKVDMSNSSDEYSDKNLTLTDAGHKSKEEFNKEFDYSTKKPDLKPDNSGGTIVKADGKFITDLAMNPIQIPMYDGYTMDIESFDVDYSKFWGSDYPNQNLHGLGDFTNSAAKNNVSFEFSSNDPTSKNSSGRYPAGSKNLRNNPTLKNVNGIWTVDGRLAVALPPGAIIEASIFESLISTHWTNESRYTGRDGGTKALQYISGVFSGDLLAGLYVDIILEDGRVLPVILTDLKALHTGIYSNGDDCRDPLLEGYGHWRGFSGGSHSYNGIIEVCISSDYKRDGASMIKEHLGLAENKIDSFRVYKNVYNFKFSSDAPTVFNNVFTGGN